MAQHTPGPWVNDDGLVNGRESRARFAPGVSIDIFDAAEWPTELKDEALANAALIASAPAMRDLIEGLKSLLRVTEHDGSQWVSADAFDELLASYSAKGAA